MSKKRLGRGLDALLSSPRQTPKPAGDAAGQAPLGAENIASEQGIAIADIYPSPYQPRRHFDQQALAELADSITHQGLLQPVIVRARPQGGYELIAGERRWRAAKLAGLNAIPAVVKIVTDAQASAFGLIENMQREDLNAMEEAMGLARLRDEFGLTQQQIADAVGKSRVAIANLLRLMNLGSITKELLNTGSLEMGHARALLALDGLVQDQTAQRVVDQGLSVRQTEALVRSVVKGGGKQKSVKPADKDPDTLRLEQRLTETIGAPVSIKHARQGNGELTIKYSNLDELDGVLKHLGISV